jgi:hypothetical protein
MDEPATKFGRQSPFLHSCTEMPVGHAEVTELPEPKRVNAIRALLSAAGRRYRMKWSVSTRDNKLTITRTK